MAGLDRGQTSLNMAMSDLPVIKKTDIAIDSRSRIGEGQFVRSSTRFLEVFMLLTAFLESIEAVEPGIGMASHAPAGCATNRL